MRPSGWNLAERTKRLISQRRQVEAERRLQYIQSKEDASRNTPAVIGKAAVIAIHLPKSNALRVYKGHSCSQHYKKVCNHSYIFAIKPWLRAQSSHIIGGRFDNRADIHGEDRNPSAHASSWTQAVCSLWTELLSQLLQFYCILGPIYLHMCSQHLSILRFVCDLYKEPTIAQLINSLLLLFIADQLCNCWFILQIIKMHSTKK
jgi:hypothetical protein